MGFTRDKYKERLFFNSEEINSEDGEVFDLVSSKFADTPMNELPLRIKVQLCDKIIGSKELIGRSPYAIFEKIKKNKFIIYCSVPIFLPESSDKKGNDSYFKGIITKYEEKLSEFVTNDKISNIGSNIYEEIAYFNFCLYVENQTLINAETLVSKLIDNLESSISPPTLFISHASEDKPFVDKLFEELDKYNYNIWYDKHEILVGDCIVEKINEGLKKSDYLVIVLSAISIKKTWVKRELNSFLADALSKDDLNILPVLLEECEIPILINDIKYADFRKSFEEGFLALNQSIRKKL